MTASALILEDIDFSYPAGAGVRGISFALAEGEFAGLIGPNGSGKSTLLKIAAGFLSPSGGRVRLFGKDISVYTEKQRARLTSYLPQVLDMDVPFTVGELASMGAYPLEEEQIITPEEAVEAAGLTGKFHSPVGELSGGERRRAFIAMTLVQGARVLLLDEPLANLDIKYQVELTKFLKEIAVTKGISIIMALHDLYSVRAFDALLALKEGSLYANGAPADVFTEDFIKEVFGVDASIRSKDSVGCLRPVEESSSPHKRKDLFF
jgi:iron complex transport system ATP-binding protein